MARIDPATRVVTGHQAVGTVEELMRYQRLVTDALAYVRRDVAAGKGREEIIAGGLPPELAGRTTALREAVARWLGQIYATATGDIHDDA